VTGRRPILLAGAAAVLTCIAIVGAARFTGTVSTPVLVLLLATGPFAFVFLAIPAVIYPLLVAKCPLDGPRFKWALVLALVPLAASAAYLYSQTGTSGGREEDVIILGIVGLVLAILAAIARLREKASDTLTLAYHGVLVVWFFAFSFPYLGEVP
jgi:hypothetical protein